MKLERYSESEAVAGIAKGHAVQATGAVVLRVPLAPPAVPCSSRRASRREPTVVLIRFKSVRCWRE
eukprot:3522792-Alexandrium_andersonii.AAC.1